MREMDAFEQAYKNGYAAGYVAGEESGLLEGYNDGYEAGMRDAESKIVRCKDCKHLYFKDMSAYCPFKVSACRPNDFCSLGERRRDG